MALALVGNAWGLSLGRVSVQSLLGEPLRAEIDVPAISDTEAASLQVGIAPAERFRAADLEFNPLLQDVALELQRRPNGRAVIVVRSDRPVSEPFLDLVVQLRWAGGELLRSYTLLFDPPYLEPPAPVAPAVAPAAPPAPAPQDHTAEDAPPASSVAQTPAAQPAAPSVATAKKVIRITVRAGDTAGRIAAAYKPAHVTLEQMLVALLRANPRAFIRANVNLVRAGAVIDIPDAALAAEVDAREARRIVAAQTRDFNEYRRRLAAAAPKQDVPPASRATAGQVQAEVAEDKAQTQAQDKLTLSKPGTADAAEDKIAEERQRSETEQRVAELSRNLQELQQLQQAASAALDALPASETAAGSATASPAADASAIAPPDSTSAQAPAPVAPAVPSAAAPAPADQPATPAPVEPPAAQSSLLRSILGHPATILAGVGLILLLALLALWRMRQRQRAAPDAPTSVPTVDAIAPTEDADDAARDSSPASVSASEPDVEGDLDPVALADVYLAHGRDQQAEEILLEALRQDPQRLPVRLKLLEIFAQRSDAARFEAAARELLALTQGQGPEWQQACAWGLTLDPDNPLYRPGGGASPAVAAADAARTDSVPELDIGPDDAAGAADLTSSGVQDPAANDTLDFESDLTAQGAQPSTPPQEASASAADEQADSTFELDVPDSVSTEAASGTELRLPPSLEGLSLELPSQEDEAQPPAQTVAAEPASEAPITDTARDDAASPEITDGLSEHDPLETKLSLAREFEAIGDIDGARTLAEEVVAEASGELRERARAFLAQLA